MKIVKVVSNRLRPHTVRVVRYLLDCGHVQKVTLMEANMRPAPAGSRFYFTCHECGR